MTNEEFIKANSLDGEIWKDVVGFEGLYVVSNHGRVISLEKHKCLNGNTIITPPKIKKPTIYNVTNEYKRYNYTLCKEGKVHCITCHRLVALAFIPNPDNYPCIDHIDGNPLNNLLSNLRWVSQSQNINNPSTHYKMCKKVCQIKDGKLVKVWCSLTDTLQIGCTISGVCRCCNGGRKTHRGYQWMYLSDYETLINKSKN